MRIEEEDECFGMPKQAKGINRKTVEWVNRSTQRDVLKRIAS